MSIGHTDARLPKDAKPRLGGQNGLVLQRLRRGPATNLELEMYSRSRRINSRVADVRRYLEKNEGKTVATKPIDVKRGIYQYSIRRAER